MFDLTSEFKKMFPNQCKDFSDAELNAIVYHLQDVFDEDNSDATVFFTKDKHEFVNSCKKFRAVREHKIRLQDNTIIYAGIAFND